MYEPDDCLMISGLQHFRFCRRQWALIHIEQQWAENLRTVEGELMHERAHDGHLAAEGFVRKARNALMHAAELGKELTSKFTEIGIFHRKPLTLETIFGER